MRLRYTDAAAQEVDEAIKYYERQRDGLGQGFFEALGECGDRVKSNPHGFARDENSPPGREVRRVALDRFPYSLVYEIQEGEMIVIAVAHHSRKPGYWKRRKG